MDPLGGILGLVPGILTILAIVVIIWVASLVKAGKLASIAFAVIGALACVFIYFAIKNPDATGRTVANFFGF